MRFQRLGRVAGVLRELHMKRLLGGLEVQGDNTIWEAMFHVWMVSPLVIRHVFWTQACVTA